MLRHEIALSITGLQQYIMHNMTVDLPDGSYHFGNDICTRNDLCPLSNVLVQLFFDAYFSEKVLSYLILLLIIRQIFITSLKKLILVKKRPPY
jgi:hypothetical protein